MERRPERCNKISSNVVESSKLAWAGLVAHLRTCESRVAKVGGGRK